MISDDPNLEIRLATREVDLLGAQRLRYRVFVEELGGDGPLVDHAARLERDAFDPHYDHLVLIDHRRPTESFDHVVGVYRLMPGDRAAQAGGFYCAAEYDLDRLIGAGRPILELGRSCVDAQFRGGSAMYLLWTALADYIAERGIEVLFGVASFHGTDIGALSNALSFLHHRHLAPDDLRVRAVEGAFQPMDLVPADQVDRRAAMQSIPALIKAYLRMGGYVGEGAFIDHAFNTTDVCLVMDIDRIAPRQRALYARETA